MPNSGASPEAYVDRSLGQKIVPEALRAIGFVVHTEIAVFGSVESGVADQVWLERAGRENWIVFTKDSRIRYRLDERDALVAGAVRAFVLASGNLTSREQADRFTRHGKRILELVGEPGPYVFSIQAERIVRLFP